MMVYVKIATLLNSQATNFMQIFIIKNSNNKINVASNYMTTTANITILILTGPVQSDNYFVISLKLNISLKYLIIINIL